MGTPSTGYIFIRVSSSDEQWRLAALYSTLEVLGGIQRIKKAFAKAEDTTGLSLERLCERAALSKRGGLLTFDLAGFLVDLRFPRIEEQAPFRYLRVEVPTHAFSDLQGDPMRVELFAEEWIRLVEAQGAEVAFFPDGIRNTELFVSEYLNTVEQDNLQYLVSTRYWRTYLSPAAASRWQERQKEPWTDPLEKLPSGALVFSAGNGHNPILGDEDAELNVHFLWEQIEKRPDVPGKKRLLAILRQEEQRLQETGRALDELNDREHRYLSNEDEPEFSYFGVYSPISDEREKALPRLDEVRAIWACALERDGLVGVMQEVSKSTGEMVVVPVVANDGRTWLIATLLPSFELDNRASNDPQKRLEAWARHLLEAAQYHPIAGVPPRLVIYFWRGVSEPMRMALLAMGAGVEVADHLPVLAQ